MTTKILITGSGGFIFSNFIRYAIHAKLPFTFVSIDKIREEFALDNFYVNKNHKFYIGDITDEHFVDVIFKIERPDIVINGAAETHVDKSISHPNQFIDSNVFGTQVLINTCLKYEVKKFLQMSTDEVYGQLTTELDNSWAEETTLNPRNPYSASKASAELLVKAAHETHGLVYNIIRSCNNYGRRQDVTKFIPKTINAILTKSMVPVYGNGNNIRDWIFVDDCCSAISKILLNGKDNEIYNISANCEISNIELIQKICSILNHNINDLILWEIDRAGHDFRYSLNNSKIKSLGWEPENTLIVGLGKTINWYLSNQWFLKIKGY